jgi:hypothetical protein
MLLRVQQTLVTVQQIVRKAACAGHRSFSVWQRGKNPVEKLRSSHQRPLMTKNPTFTPRNQKPSEGKSRN